MVAHQVLQEDVVSLVQLDKVLGLGLPLLPTRDVPPGHCVLPVVEQLAPGVVGIVVARRDG